MTSNEKYEVLKAWFNGEEVEFRRIDRKDKWYPLGTIKSGIKPLWEWNKFEYRVKGNLIMLTEDKITVMQAWLDGKKIEMRNCNFTDSPWICIDTPSWNWADNEYRVKIDDGGIF